MMEAFQFFSTGLSDSGGHNTNCDDDENGLSSNAKEIGWGLLRGDIIEKRR